MAVSELRLCMCSRGHNDISTISMPWCVENWTVKVIVKEYIPPSCHRSMFIVSVNFRFMFRIVVLPSISYRPSLVSHESSQFEIVKVSVILRSYFCSIAFRLFRLHILSAAARLRLQTNFVLFCQIQIISYNVHVCVCVYITMSYVVTYNPVWPTPFPIAMVTMYMYMWPATFPSQ